MTVQVIDKHKKLPKHYFKNKVFEDVIFLGFEGFVFHAYDEATVILFGKTYNVINCQFINCVFKNSEGVPNVIGITYELTEAAQNVYFNRDYLTYNGQDWGLPSFFNTEILYDGKVLPQKGFAHWARTHYDDNRKTAS